MITVKISIEKRLLLCETLVNKKYKGLTSGLMGNFDDIESNDFMLPNGTELDENATKTERDVFYNFGQHCKFIFLFMFFHLNIWFSVTYDSYILVGIKLVPFIPAHTINIYS